ncbi:MAG: CRISPR-associated protein Cas4 [Clostridia bacterium]|nr:CRISPR-associated protein Cas4 [Clostridia bacterium]
MASYYSDDQLLQLSGIQHFAFCERQWALIYIEQQWADNVRTVEGKHIHERADNTYENETRGNIRITRSVPLVSRKLGLQGIADVIEYVRDDGAREEETVEISGRRGRWRVHPVEYKRGKPKKDDRDIVQLYAQAMALEEMLGIRINKGYLFYNEIRHRSEIVFNEDERKRVVEIAARMHEMMDKGFVPKARKEKHCQLCSLIDVCQPGWDKSTESVRRYLENHFGEDC